MSHITATLTPVTTIYTVVVNGKTFRDMREVSRWEGFVKLTGNFDGVWIAGVFLLPSESGFAPAMAKLFDEMGIDSSLKQQPAVFIAGTPSMIELIKGAP